jgi:hypothetical protein
MISLKDFSLNKLCFQLFFSQIVLDIFTQHLQNLSGLEMKVFSKDRIRYRIFYEQNLNQFTKVNAFFVIEYFQS